MNSAADLDVNKNNDALTWDPDGKKLSMTEKNSPKVLLSTQIKEKRMNARNLRNKNHPPSKETQLIVKTIETNSFWDTQS